MASLEEIRNERLEKLARLEERGVNPYPTTSYRDMEIKDALSNFESLAQSQQIVTLAGRILSLRPQGKITFITFDDGSASFQAMMKEESPISPEQYELFSSVSDIGDFFEFTGTIFLSKRGEKSILVHSWRMLTKSLRPLPEKWHGLQDIEERLRRRYLDLISHEEVKERFMMRSRIISFLRNYYLEAGYIEVDLPNLQPLAGGATALPFTTHHNALGVDFYLPIAQELYLKQLLIGGFTKVFELGKRFRNEGIDATHNPEFTMLESNSSFEDAASQRAFIEDMFRSLITHVYGEPRLTVEGVVIDVEKPFEVITFYDVLKRYTDIAHPENLDREAARVFAEEHSLHISDTDALEKILDQIYKKMARPHLQQPTFIIDYPVAFNPFAKRKEDNPSLIDRFQLIIGGVELVNAFSELNNPLDQKARYLEEDKKGSQGEGEISPSDEAYLEAMEYGMPPNGGIGIGVDRLVMLLTGVKNIKEVILFPTLRPKE